MKKSKYFFKFRRSLFFFSNLRWLDKMPFLVTNGASTRSTGIIRVNACPCLLKNTLHLFQSIQSRHFLSPSSRLLRHRALWLRIWLILGDIWPCTVLRTFSTFTRVSCWSRWRLIVVIPARRDSSWGWNIRIALILIVLGLSCVVRLLSVLIVIRIHSHVLDFEFVILVLLCRCCIIKLVLGCRGLIT